MKTGDDKLKRPHLADALFFNPVLTAPNVRAAHEEKKSAKKTPVAGCPQKDARNRRRISVSLGFFIIGRLFFRAFFEHPRKKRQIVKTA